MALPGEAEPVKLLVAALWASPDGHDGKAALERALKRLEPLWGVPDYRGPDHLFDTTDYYEKEMGPRLQRCLISFRDLFPPERLGEAKHQANAIEAAETLEATVEATLEVNMKASLASGGGRLVNLDVGYLDLNKIVLASFKGAGQKIYLGGGAWADLVARYRAGRYQPFEWTFPDFRDGRYDTELQAIRQTYRAQLAAWRAIRN